MVRWWNVCFSRSFVSVAAHDMNEKVHDAASADRLAACEGFTYVIVHMFLGTSLIPTYT
jgi:hypothetical protein